MLGPLIITLGDIIAWLRFLVSITLNFARIEVLVLEGWHLSTDTKPEAMTPLLGPLGSSCQWTAGKGQIFCVSTDTGRDNHEETGLLLQMGGKKE